MLLIIYNHEFKDDYFKRTCMRTHIRFADKDILFEYFHRPTEKLSSQHYLPNRPIGVHFAKCPQIEPAANENLSGPIYESNYCIRNCIDGFKPVHPKKVLVKEF